MRFLCGGSRDHRSICVQAHEFFSDSNGQLTESLPGKQVLHLIQACVTITNDLILTSSGHSCIPRPEFMLLVLLNIKGSNLNN